MHTLDRLARHDPARREPALCRFTVANTLSETAIRAEPLEGAMVRESAWKRWPKRIFLLLLLLWVADTSISVLIRHSRLQRKITARLESAFGRSVEVGRYNFSLWGWPTFEAQSVTVGEDPRFGHEYFLRADSLTMRLRWRSVLRGRLEFGTFSLTRPSLNLVRDSMGDWNLAEWLPRPSAPTSPAPPVGPLIPPSSPIRFTRIEVDSGRINFKGSDEKLPFAFIHVNGYLELESPGRWQFDLEATPMRAAVIPQQTGTLHLSGHVGGTSSRLRPAVLNLSWTGASISDVLRLARNYDYGIRGSLALQLNARTAAEDWLVEGRAELRQLHRWDLSLRADNPAVNLSAKVHWNPAMPGIQLQDLTFEGPHSHARARAELSWDHRRLPLKEQLHPFGMQIRSAEIDLGDLLSWLRAFRSGVADDVSVRGSARLDVTLVGWPSHIEDATLELGGAELFSPRLRVPLRLSPSRIHYDTHGVLLTPLALRFGADNGPFTGYISADGGTVEQEMKGASNLRVVGRIHQVRDVVAVTSALGWNISRGWDVAGPATFEFLWGGGRYPWQVQPRGTLEWGGELGGASLAAPFLNLPVEQIRARVDFLRGARVITLRAAEAFGAHWKGTFSRPSGGSDWEFGLSADHLATADLDRWLNPRWRQNFLNRMLPFLNSPSPVNAIPETLRASGKLTADQFALAPFAAHRLQGEVNLVGRRIEFRNAKAQFYGGELAGLFEAELTAPPAYHLNLNFSHVDLSELTSTTPALADLFAGNAYGQITLNARGATRADLLASLECQGAGHVEGAELHNLSLPDSLRLIGVRLGASPFREASSAFTCASRKIQFQELTLLTPHAELDGSGTVDFSRNLDFRLGVFSSNVAGTPITHVSASPVAAYHLTGPLATPQVTRASATTARP
jgi:hypothetical protein